MRRSHGVVLVVSMLLLAAPVAAQDPGKLASIRAEQEQIRSRLGDGSLGVTPRVALLIRKDQAAVFRLLGDNARLEDLNVAERVELDNALERIGAHLAGTREAAEQRDVCRYERVSGSKHRKLVCASSDERQNARDGARAWMEKPRVCIPPGCGA
jgi:hypothetical protein